MGLRELKETAHQQFVRGKFAQCAQTYHQILKLAPRDPNMRVRHAEACRRAGDRLQAIASYRTAAELLLELGCESRARGALKAALELDPRDPLLQADIARLGSHRDELFSFGSYEREELPLLPPLESGLDPVPPPPPPAPRPAPPMRREALLRTPTLPRIHRALPSVPSVPPLMPPVLLPSPAAPSTASGTPIPSPAPRAPTPPPRSATMGSPAPAPRPASAPLPPRSATVGAQGPTPVPPPPPPEALRENNLGVSLARTATGSVAPAPAEDRRPRPEVRRLSANAIAFRCSPSDSWALIRSHTPLEMHLVDDLEKLPPMMRDLTPEATIEPGAEGASTALH